VTSSLCTKEQDWEQLSTVCQSEYAKRGDGMTSRNVHVGVYIS
jgi:hypothetical protein